jgi:TDG/mug DNA glycosylase family protein
LIGYQERRDWMGSPVLTLAEVVPAIPRAMIVGLNPAPPSVAVGHYYQGSLGRRLLQLLARHEVFAEPDGPHFEEPALRHSVGFTDLVKRPTARASDLSRSEVAYGRGELHATLSRAQVPVVICVFREAADALLEGPTVPGWQDGTTTWGARIFRMPPPFMKREDAATVMQTLSRALD